MGANRQEDTTTASLRELRAAYQAQLAHIASERDEARRQARRAKGEADVARADLAILKARVHELLSAASAHLPALEAPRKVRQAEDAPPGKNVGSAKAVRAA